MTEVTHSEKQTASGKILHYGNRLGETVIGKYLVEYGDSFIITREGGWNVYNKVEPSTIVFK